MDITSKPFPLFLMLVVFCSAPVCSETVDSTQPELDLGPSSVPSQLKEIEYIRKSEHPSWPSIPSFAEYNLSLAADYQVLAQQLNSSPSETSAIGGALRLYGTWNLDAESSAPGRLVFKVENRHRIGTTLSPQVLLPSAGVSGVSGPTFSDKKSVLTNLYWGQSFKNNEFGYIAGIIDVADFLDVYGLINVWTEFNNLAFATNPTIPTPAQGLGVAGRWLMPSNYYITGSISDINGNPHRPEDAFDSFFNTSEHLSHLEFGRIGSWDERWANNIHVTLWHADERKEASIPSDWGATATLSQRFGQWLPFLRLGIADRGVSFQQKTLSTGIGYTISQTGDFVGVGISWGQTANNDRDQYLMETYYKWQLYKHILLVPSIQWIHHPSHNNTEDNLYLAALKLRVTF